MNRLKAGVLVIVEHTISGIKSLKAVSCEVYRTRRQYLDDQLMLIACGIWNYHLKLVA